MGIRRKRISDPSTPLNRIIAVLVLMILTMGGARAALAQQPQLADTNKFRIELYADFAEAEGGPADAMELTFTSGENGFPAGLYATTGFDSPPNRDGIFRVEGPGVIRVVRTGLNMTESMVFARGGYGDGMLITEPGAMQIRRLLSDGTLETFASLGTAPFGPAVLTYGADDSLYVTDLSGGTVLRVRPDGSSSVFATIPLPPPGGTLMLAGAKPVVSDFLSLYGGAFVAGTFTLDSEPSGLGALYSVSANGADVNQIVGGLDGLEMVTPGPGGVWGEAFYAATMGPIDSNGAVHTVAPDGTLTPFMTGINYAIDVAFDTEGILGGGMFVVADVAPGPAKIWRVTVKEEIPTLTEWALIVFGIVLLGFITWVFLKRRKVVGVRA